MGADPARCGVVMGGGVGGLTTLEEQIGVRIEKGAMRVSPFLVPMMMVETQGTIAMRFGWTGSESCASPPRGERERAIGEAARLIRLRRGRRDARRGAECSITPTGHGRALA